MSDACPTRREREREMSGRGGGCKCNAAKTDAADAYKKNKKED